MKPLKVIAGAQDHPLEIGGVKIDCYVLEDETRVLSRSGFQAALGRHPTSRKHQQDDVVSLPAFLAAANLKPFISKDLVTASTPVEFQAPSRGPVAHGFRAELLPQVCEVYLKAREAGALLPSQEHIALQVEILIRALATVGVIALVDEATGYQRIREERALATILERYIVKELQPWTRTFPYEFYQLLYKRRGWPGPDGHKRTSQVGRDTNDLIYERLPPGVFEELKARTPRLPSGNLKNKYFQWFTPEHGHPKLEKHIEGVMALLRAAPNWSRFKGDLNRAYPKMKETIPLPLDDNS